MQADSIRPPSIPALAWRQTVRDFRAGELRQLLDASLQVTGKAGGYQVDGAKKFATLNIGGSGTTSCVFVVGV